MDTLTRKDPSIEKELAKKNCSTCMHRKRPRGMFPCEWCTPVWKYWESDKEETVSQTQLKTEDERFQHNKEGAATNESPLELLGKMTDVLSAMSTTLLILYDKVNTLILKLDEILKESK